MQAGLRNRRFLSQRTSAIPVSVKGGTKTAVSRMLDYKEGEEKVDMTFITGTNAFNSRNPHQRRATATSNFPNIGANFKKLQGQHVQSALPNARANLTAGYPRPKYTLGNVVTPGANTGRMRSQLMSD